MNKTILYVDDEPWFVEALIDALVDEGYRVLPAIDGTEAVQKVKSASPDLIILDLIMPTGEEIDDTNGGRRTGLKVHEIIRSELNLSIPIIFLTVVDDPAAERSIIELEKQTRINKYSILVKPVLPTELLEKVDKMLREEK